MKKFFPFLVFLFIGSFFGEAVMAECRIWVDGYYRKNGTYVKGHYRTCPDGNKNNNYGSPDYKGQPARERDKDGDGLPNYLDRDDNNNGLSDNTDHAIDKILREEDPRRARVPRYQNYKRYDDYPLVTELLDSIIVYMPRRLNRTTHYKWDRFGNCNEYSRQGYYIGSAHKDVCREEAGSYFAWDRFGNCNEYTPDKNYIQSMHKNYCRAYVGRYFAWDRFGNCNEYTPDKNYIESANKNVCRETVGSFYEFDRFGNCNEYTPSRDYIRSADKNYCRYENYGALDQNPAIIHGGVTVKSGGSTLRALELSVETALGHSAQ